jgi:CDP-Glycerol:Poly(glycerophosphate) glycerophosphotransferase
VLEVHGAAFGPGYPGCEGALIAAPIDAGGLRGREPNSVWLVITGGLSVRTFVETGIVDMLDGALGDALLPVLWMDERTSAAWAPRVAGRPIRRAELESEPASRLENLYRRADVWLDRRAGLFPLAIRLNYRHGFHLDRMRPGHRIRFLDSDRTGPLPSWRWLEAEMRRWHFSSRRHVPRGLARRMQVQCRALVLTNVNIPSVVPFLTAARRWRIPVVGYIASWDHTVGKGVISPHLDRYLVQNESMRSDLRRYHGVSEERVTVTGWPQTDVFHHRRPRSAYEQLLRRYGLDPSRPVVLFAGNHPTNMPYEGTFIARLVEWWERTGAHERFSLLLRPHPRDFDRDERFRAAADRPNAHVQDSSFEDFDTLVTVLQHVDCVITNGGTIALDAIVNDRPTICVAYDEGAPAGERWAAKSLSGEHYRTLADSAAWYRADSFDDVTTAIGRALDQPAELGAQRAAATRAVVGEIDGMAAARVVDAILALVGGASEAGSSGPRSSR